MNKWRIAWLCIRGKLDLPDLYHRVDLEERKVAHLRKELEVERLNLQMTKFELNKLKGTPK